VAIALTSFLNAEIKCDFRATPLILIIALIFYEDEWAMPLLFVFANITKIKTVLA